MAWICCQSCLLRVADDGETPFADRDDFTLDGGRWTWTPSPTLSSGQGFRVDVDGNSLGVTIVPVRIPAAAGFRVSTDTSGFLYIDSLPVAYTPAHDIAHITLGFGWYDRNVTAILFAEYFNSSGEKIDSAAIPIRLTDPGTTWEISSVDTLLGASKIWITELGGQVEPCCPVPPPTKCDNFRYDGWGELNYLARGMPTTPPYYWDVDYFTRRERIETIVRTDSGASFYVQLGFGDCCDLFRFTVDISGADGTAYVRSWCGHGGPILLATIPLGGTFVDTDDPRDYHAAVCVSQRVLISGEDRIEETLVEVFATDSNGVSLFGRASGPWLMLDDARCIAESNGLTDQMAELHSLDAYTTSGYFVDARLDNCECVAGTPSGIRDDCLDRICIYGSRPPWDPPPDPLPSWKLTLNLPGKWAFANEPSRPANPLDGCPCEPTTTETTSADGNLLFNPDRVAEWDAFIDAHFPAVSAPTEELYCSPPTWCATIRDSVDGLPWFQVRAQVFVPLGHDAEYTAQGQIPIFLIVCLAECKPVASNPDARCWIVTQGDFAAVSNYANCRNPIEFSLLSQSQVVRCYSSVGNIIDCSECISDDTTPLVGATATLTPIYE